MPNYGDFQLEIYLQGLAGVRPQLPMTFAELEARAARCLSPEILSYVAGGAGDEHTQDGNVTAFDRYGLVPRMLAGAAERDVLRDESGKIDLPLHLVDDRVRRRPQP